MAPSQQDGDIAVIGMACRFPHAADITAFWRLLRAGYVAYEAITDARWRHASFYSPDTRAVDKTYVQKGAFIDRIEEFAALHHGLAPRRVQVTDPQQRLLVEVVRQALQDAGYDRKMFDRANTGVFVGASVSEYKDLLTSRLRAQSMIDGTYGGALTPDEAARVRTAVADVVPTRAFTIAGSLLNMLAATVSHVFDLSGPSFTIDAACSSSLVAVHEAVLQLRARQCDVALAGGAYLNLTPDNLVGFSRIGAMSPSGACRPFDARADGFVMGEGVGVVVLRRWQDARHDGDRIYAVIRGSGCSNDGRGDGPMTPRPAGQIDAMRRAHQDAGDVPIETVEFIEAHGTGTAVGDAVEVDALKTFFNTRAGRTLTEPYCYLSSIKANIGHTMSAAGIASFIKAVLTLHYKIVVPQPGIDQVNPTLGLQKSPFRIARTAVPWAAPVRHPRRAAVSSFGFGGTNAHVLLEGNPESGSPSAERHELFLVSAPTAALLATHLRELADTVEDLALRPGAVAYTLASRAPFEARVAFVAKGRQQLVAELRRTSDAAPAERRPPRPKLAFLFPGQGGQRVGLLRELFDRFPLFRARLEALAVAASTDMGCSMLESLYPSAPYSAEATHRHLTQTHVCQPVMVALGVALAELFRSCGVEPDVVLGHSVGEFAAAAVAGMLSVEDAVRLVARRGQLMRRLPLVDAGAMLAVTDDRSTVAADIRDLEGVWLANHNHPRQVVIAGTRTGVSAARARLEARGRTVALLDVSHAFHTPLMRGIEEDMRSVLASLPVNAPAMPVISCVTARAYASAAEAKELWARHASAPVDFVRALGATGAQLYVQLGAGTTLLSFARGVTAGAAAFFSAAATAGGDDGRTFLDTLGQLFVHGIPVDGRGLTPDTERALVTLPPTPLETQRYWAVERGDRPPRVPASAGSGGAMDSILVLFREQMALLRSQQEVLKAQTAALQALAGGATAPAPTAAPEGSAPPPAAEPTRDAAAAPAPDLATEVEPRILAAVARISAFPASTLRREQALTGELGFDSLMLVELDEDIARAWPGIGGLPRDLFTARTTIGDVIDHVARALERPPAVRGEREAAEPDAALEQYVPTVTPVPLRPLRDSVVVFPGPWLITRDVCGVADAVAQELQRRSVRAEIGTIDTPGAFSGVIHLAEVGRPSDTKAPLRALLQLAQRFAEAPAAFVTVTDLGGRFAFDAAPDSKLGHVGALGFTKALAREWPNTLVKAIDIDVALGPVAIARGVIDELFSGDRSAEIGLTRGGRVVVTLRNAPRRTMQAVSEDTVVFVSGGARGLGLTFARALAQRYGCTLALAGRSLPTKETAEAVASVKAAGARACTYHVMDVRAPESVATAVRAVRGAHGAIDVVIHAAGVVADALVANKRMADVEAVVATKVDGARTLLELVGDSLTLAVFIGSWAGRFGSAGQTDYSAANEMMARLCVGSPFRAVAIDFPPFADSALARGIPAFKRAEMAAAGVPALSADDGVRALLDAVAGAAGEVVIGRRLPERLVEARGRFPLSRCNHVYLNDHEIGGQSVLPLAAALDHLATAGLDTTSGPDFRPLTVRDFRARRPVRVTETTWLEIEVRGPVHGGRDEDVDVTLSEGAAPSYRGVVGHAHDVPDVRLGALPPSALPLSLREFYDRVTFHGPRLQGIVSIEGLADDGVSGTVRGCTPAEWVKEPLRDTWTVDPLIIDSGLQLAGYWAWVTHGRAGLPVGFGQYTQLAPFGVEPVKCTGRLESLAGDTFRGTLVWRDARGRLLAVMTGLEGQLTSGDPEGAATALPPALGAASNGSAAPVPAVDPATYEFDKFREYRELRDRLALADTLGVNNPYFTVHERIGRDTTQVNGQELINFSSYNYVGNVGDPVVSAAAKAAIDTYGTSVSASRLASGERPLHRELEQALARFFDTEDCLVFTSGHATNVTVIGHLLGADDLVLHDALAHDSIIQGAKLSGAKRRPFPHNDPDALDRMLGALRTRYRRVLVCLEGVYSMDGDIPDLPRFIDVKKRHHTLLLVDEAHSAGVIGNTGRGIGEYCRVARSDVDLWMGTLSKAFASCGGYICGAHPLVEYLRYTVPGFVYSVGMSPPNAAAALAALRQLVAHPERVLRAQAQARKFLGLLKERSIDTGRSRDSAVVPAIIGDSVRCLRLADRLRRRGINVQPIVHPAVEETGARLRFFVSCLHTDEQLMTTADILAEELARLADESRRLPAHP